MKEINKIWKFLQQQLNSEEKQSLYEWKNISEENLDLYNDLEKIWSESEHLEEIQLVDSELHWGEIEEKIEKRKAPVIKKIRWIGIAASILLIVASILWFYPKNEVIIPEPLYQIYTAVEMNEELQLPDNSVVHLDKGSTLRYFSRMDESFTDRRVFVKGKATFDVEPNDSLAFVVEVAQTGVKVLGTVFKVEYQDSNSISVENIEGLIKFYELANEANAVTLEQGEKFNFDGNSFIDKTPKPEVKEVVKVVERNYTIQELWYALTLKYESKIKIISYGSQNPDASIRINLDQPLGNIIKSLKINPNIEISYKQTCPDCYEIETLKIVN